MTDIFWGGAGWSGFDLQLRRLSGGSTWGCDRDACEAARLRAFQHDPQLAQCAPPFCPRFCCEASRKPPSVSPGCRKEASGLPAHAMGPGRDADTPGSARGRPQTAEGERRPSSENGGGSQEGEQGEGLHNGSPGAAKTCVPAEPFRHLPGRGGADEGHPRMAKHRGPGRRGPSSSPRSQQVLL